ncbi:MAG: septum formation initiator family protein [Bacteroidota bacterium]
MVKQQFPKIIYFIVLAIVLVILIFSDNGLLKYYELNRDLDNLKTKIEEAKSEIQKLDLQIDSLKNSTVKIEKVAREKYRMKYDYEIPIKIKTK